MLWLAAEKTEQTEIMSTDTSIKFFKNRTPGIGNNTGTNSECLSSYASTVEAPWSGWEQNAGVSFIYAPMIDCFLTKLMYAGKSWLMNLIGARLANLLTFLTNSQI